jgi:hypothetical protein
MSFSLGGRGFSPGVKPLSQRALAPEEGFCSFYRNLLSRAADAVENPALPKEGIFQKSRKKLNHPEPT